VSDTPKTDAAENVAELNYEMSRECGDPPFPGAALADFARQLERELNRMKQSAEWADQTRLRLAEVFDVNATAWQVCEQAEKLKSERDQWCKMAEELAKALKAHRDNYLISGVSSGANEVLANFKKLSKG